MGAIQHNDIQVDETGANPIRELIREVNSQLRRVAQIATANFRNPMSIPVTTARTGVIWIPQEPFEILSFDVYNAVGPNATITAITDGGAGIPVTGLPVTVTAATHINIPCTSPYRVDPGSDVAFTFGVTNAEDTAVGINVRRLG